MNDTTTSPQEVRVTVRLSYQADPAMSADELRTAIMDDVNRLTDADSESPVELLRAELIELQEEAAIYGTDEPAEVSQVELTDWAGGSWTARRTEAEEGTQRAWDVGRSLLGRSEALPSVVAFYAASIEEAREKLEAKPIDLDRFAKRGEAEEARRIVRKALAAGYALSVHDGEEATVRGSRDEAKILAALATTDADTVTVHRRDLNNASGWHSVGVLLLVWGNAPDGSELVADHTDNETLRQLVENEG